jgi:PPP family 3-phenylpropionic acid transporter
MTNALLTVEEQLTLKKSHRTVKGLYFFYFAGVGTFFPFLSVYYLSLGLSGTQIGLINTLGPLVGIFSTTLWGVLSDRFGKTRVLLAVATLGAMLAVTGLSRAQTFAWILPAACSLALFNSTFIPLMDSTTLSLLGDQRERYGVFRVWGTVGFILTSAAIGLIYTRFGLPTMFKVYFAVLILFLITSIGMPDQPIRLHGSLIYGLKEMLRQPAWVLFAVSVFLLWVASSGALAFFSLAIQALGGSDQLIGLSWTTAAITELPVFFFSAVLLRKFGAVRLLFIAFIGYILRILSYGLMPSPGWAPVVNLLNCVSYVPFWLGAVSYANQLASPSLKATAQGLLFAVLNLSNVSGALFSGWLFDQVGPAHLFFVLSGFAVAGFLLFSLGHLLFRQRPAESLR